MTFCIEKNVLSMSLLRDGDVEDLNEPKYWSIKIHFMTIKFKNSNDFICQIKLLFEKGNLSQKLFQS